MKILSYSKFNEGKNYGELYHFTNLLRLYSILESDELSTNSEFAKDFELGHSKKKYTYYVSLTRDRNFSAYNILDYNVRSGIIINSDKLTNNYKVMPVNYFSRKKKVPGNFESEEAVLLHTPYLQGISRYIDSLIIPNFEAFVEEIDSYIRDGYEFAKLTELDYVYERIIGESISEAVEDDLDSWNGYTRGDVSKYLHTDGRLRAFYDKLVDEIRHNHRYNTKIMTLDGKIQ